MAGGTYLTIPEALGVSLTGFFIVFLTLISIAIFIKLISIVVGSIAGKQEKKPQENKVATQTKPQVNNLDNQILAAIIAAVSEEMKISVDKFRIVSIDEKK